MNPFRFFLWLGILSFSFQTLSARADAPSNPPVTGVVNRSPASTRSPAEAQKVDVDALKKQYWIEGSGMDMKVVQNRIYTKAWKLNVELMAATFNGDPFLTYIAYGPQLGFYFGEYIGVHAMYWRMNSSFNSAYNTLVSATSTTAPPGYGSNSNQMQSLAGGEISWSLLYGKVSLMGQAIIHFDLFLLTGAGLLQANTGASQGEGSFSAMAFWPGIGEQLFLTPWVSFKVDFRLMGYSEDIVERNNPSTMGNLLGHRTTFAPSVAAGLNFILFP